MKHICDKTIDNLPGKELVTNISEDQCPVNQSLSILGIAREETCGKGTYCRDGINQLWQIVKDITVDKGRNDDLSLVDEICEGMKLASDCQVSTKTAELIRSSLAAYRDEWDAHLSRKKCTSLVCPAFYTVHVEPSKCTGCDHCTSVCPENAILGGEDEIHVVDNSRCTRCGECFSPCPSTAFIKAGSVKPRVPDTPVPVGTFSGGARRRRRRG